MKNERPTLDDAIDAIDKLLLIEQNETQGSLASLFVNTRAIVTEVKDVARLVAEKREKIQGLVSDIRFEARDIEYTVAAITVLCFVLGYGAGKHLRDSQAVSS